MKKRDVKMDVYKGLLVFGMIYCHVLQFFVDLGSNPTADYITWFINAVTFSGFVFSFGYTSYIAYFSKDFKSVYRRMLLVSLKLLMAFYISGIAFRVFVTNNRLSYDMVKNIVLLNDIPGWSEFIVSFAIYIAVAVILFEPIKGLVEVKPLFWVVVGLLLLTTFMPYGAIGSTRLGLIFGSTKFAAFPVLQYMPFYLIGVYFKRYEIGFDKFMLIGSLILSTISIIYMGLNGWRLPNRFPPSIFWIILPCIALYLYYLLSALLSKTNYARLILATMGQNSMNYLLLSNIFIFALDGTKGIIQLEAGTGLIANVILIGVITYIISMTKYQRLSGVKQAKVIE
jgi:hypothetical protein